MCDVSAVVDKVALYHKANQRLKTVQAETCAEAGTRSESITSHFQNGGKKMLGL